MARPSDFLRNVALCSLLAFAFGCSDDDVEQAPPVTIDTSDAGSAPDTGHMEPDQGSEAVADMAPDMPPPVPGSARITPETTLLKIGDSAPLRGQYFDDIGAEVSGVGFAWASADATIATVDSDGLVTGVGHGTTEVTVDVAEHDARASAEVAVYGPVVGVATGRAHSCAFNAEGWTWCAGDNSYGQLGVEGVGKSTDALALDLPEGTVLTAIAAGSDHTCGLDTRGGVYCWGKNTAGQLGDGTTDDSVAPRYNRFETAAVAIAAAGEISCALLQDGRLFCWGDNLTQAVDPGRVTRVTTPNHVQNARTFDAVALGDGHVCALEAGGTVLCWGDNGRSQLGPNATNAGSHTLQIVPGLYSRIWANYDVTCALTDPDSDLHCWGAIPDDNDGSLLERPEPTVITLPDGASVADLALMERSICVALGDRMVCQGSNTTFQLGAQGTGSTTVYEAYGTLAGGDEHACAIAAGVPYCWGANLDGQLGAEGQGARVFMRPAME